MNIRRGIPLALGAGILFGLSAPLSKLIVAGMDPIALAGVLYLGAFVGVSVGHLLGVTRGLQSEPLQRSDAPYVLTMITVGGVLAPVLLMFGVRAASGFTASLLLNFEGVATALIAWMFFKERVSGAVWGAVVLMTATGVLLTGVTTGGRSSMVGPLLIMGAAIGWGVDNNVSARLSHCNPLVLVSIKGLAAGLFSLGFSWATRGGLPAPRSLLAGLGVGCISYGVSLVLFILSLKAMGAARTGAFFAVGPLAGALLSLVIFRSPFTWAMAVALALTAVSIALVASEGLRSDGTQQPD
ncbi:MAG: DMT family transporter [Caldiserica bacterium]|nr:DMT family transporter [Caldisericota bacterium]